MKLLNNNTTKPNGFVMMMTTITLLLLSTLVLQPAVAQSQDPSSLIGSKCYNDTLTLSRNNNESLFAIYLGFFSQVNQNACSLGSTINCNINGTALGEELLPLCSRLGGISYQQNFTINCSTPTTQTAITGLHVTAANFSGCAAASCNLTSFEKYNIDPSYKYSFASIAVSAFQQYGVSNCQFVVVQDVSLLPSLSTTTSAAATAPRFGLFTKASWSSGMGILLMLLSAVSLG